MAADNNKKQNGDDVQDVKMPLSGHLREMRNRLIVILVVFAAAFVVMMNFSGKIINLLTDMGTQYGYKYVFIAPQELLMVYISVALIVALIITIPVIVYECYEFALPAFGRKTRRAVKTALFSGAAFFVLGVLFAYKIAVPFMLYFLISFTGETAVTASISIQEFVSFLMTVFVIFGCVFEMPVIAVALSMIGLLKPEWLIKAQKPAIVIIFLIAAIITPPDIASQILVAVPMCGLYELSIWLSKIFYKKHQESVAEKEAAADEDM